MALKKTSARVLAAMFLVFVMVGSTTTAGANPAAPERPFKATFEGTRAFADPGRCAALGDGWNLLVVDLTSGNATHLGRITGTADQCIKGLDIVDGIATYVAANGDELNATYTGTIVSVVDGVAVIEVDQTFDGGTGRFEYATGDAFELVSVDLVAGTVQGTVEGDISY
jgi:hypothetical protein